MNDFIKITGLTNKNAIFIRVRDIKSFGESPVEDKGRTFIKTYPSQTGTDSFFTIEETLSEVIDRINKVKATNEVSN